MQKGQLIAERFELEAEVASGGMGRIFRALDRNSGRQVAVKSWPPSFTGGDAEARSKQRSRRRFEREAAALATVTHPAVVRYIAHGVTHSGEPFLVMQWIAGCDLAEKLRSSGLGVSDTLLLAERMLAALVALHAHGVVHRDLKPANVMLESGQAPRAVLVDFGIARGSDALVVTGQGAQLGTPCYMSPEQIRDPRTVDGRADVFALGCILFECLTGTRAFQGVDVLGTLAQVLLDGAPDLRELRPDLPAPIVHWVMDLLASDREQRPFADAALVQRVSRLLAECPTQHLGPPNFAVGAPMSTRSTARSARETIDAPPETTPSGELAIAVSQRDRLRPSLDFDEPSLPLVAREAELAELREAFAAKQRLVALWGPPGIGKTRLALELARGASPSMGRHCDLWVDLSAAPDTPTALRLLAGRVEASLVGTEAAAVAVGRALASAGRGLAVLDGVDPLLDQLPAIVVQAQRFAPQLTLVVTSRARLSIPGALTLEIGPLATLSAREIEARPAGSLSPAAQLFLSQAKLGGPSSPLGGARLALVERIVRELEGIPLAIELAAARVPSLGIEGVLALCTEPSERSPALRSALRDALSSVWTSFSPVERRVLGACALFRGNFDAESVAAVSVLDDDPLPLLQALRDKSMLRAGSAGFSMFSVVREFALSELSASGELEAARVRHAAHAGRRAAALERLPRQRQSEFTRRVAAESDDLIAAVECALCPATRDVPLALSILCVLEPVIVARGPLPAFLDLIDRTVDAAESGSEERSTHSTRLARLLVLRARLRATSGRFREANADLHTSEQIVSGTSHAELLGSIWLERGLIHHFQRELSNARRAYERASSLLRPTEDMLSLGRCYGNLGAVFHDEGKWIAAAAYYWKAIQTLEQVGDLRVLANFLGNLALLEQELGALPSARQRYERAISLLEDVSDARLGAITVGNLGCLEAELGDWQAARRCHELALDLLVPLDDPRSLALCRARLGAALAMLGLLEDAAEQFARARTVPSADGFLVLETIEVLHAFFELGAAHSARLGGNRDIARSNLESAEATCRRAQRERSDGRSLSRLSDDIRTALRSIAPLLLDLRTALDAGAIGA